jgi:hypothetical protein
LRAGVEEFADALSRDGRRKTPSIDVTHGFVALDRRNAPVRKRNKSACCDEGFDDLFVAIEVIAQFASEVRTDEVDGHDAAPRYCDMVALKELRSAGSGRRKCLGPDVGRSMRLGTE